MFEVDSLEDGDVAMVGAKEEVFEGVVYFRWEFFGGRHLLVYEGGQLRWKLGICIIIGRCT